MVNTHKNEVKKIMSTSTNYGRDIIVRPPCPPIPPLPENNPNRIINVSPPPTPRKKKAIIFIFDLEIEGKRETCFSYRRR